MKRVLLSILIIGLICFPLICDEADAFEAEDVVEEITEKLEACAGGAGTNLGTGGMRTKLDAAKIAGEAGVDMILANGENPQIILDIINGEDIGTLFLSEK